MKHNHVIASATDDATDDGTDEGLGNAAVVHRVGWVMMVKSFQYNYNFQVCCGVASLHMIRKREVRNKCN